MKNTAGESVKSISCCNWNVRSLNNKVEDVMNFLDDNDISILFVTETWLTDQKNNTTAQIKNHGYRIYHTHRTDVSGGGVAIVYKSQINLIKVFIGHEQSFEAVSAKLKLADGSIVFCSCIYRPPKPLGSFLLDFEEFLGDAFEKYKHHIICGDVNMHLEKVSSHVHEWNSILASFGLYQLVSVPTHKKGHTLDPVITSHKIVDKSSVNVRNNIIKTFKTCDHYPAIFRLHKAVLSNKNQKKIHFRNIKNVDHDTFKSDLSLALSGIVTNTANFHDVINKFNDNCISVLNTHAPQLTKTINDIPSAPWFDGEYKVLRAKRRKAEKRWLKSGSELDHTNFIHLRDACNELSNNKKKQFFRETFNKYNHSQKSLYRFVDTFLDKESSLTLPANINLQETADTFNKYFTDKIDKIRSSFPNSTYSHNQHGFNGTPLSEFRATTIPEIQSILHNFGIKTSSIDPLPEQLLTENLDLILPILCDIVNLSLSSGSIDGIKLANLTPLIKGGSLDSEILKNYRPISNLSFVGKLIERIVNIRLDEHLASNNLSINEQSGYKKCHSTETVLVTIVNDLLVASDKNSATVVMLLDLSAAFDTVDHNKLLQILEHEIGITGTSLKWFRSFLTGRCQRVKLGECESAEIIIKFGVPQGSVLGPILFNIYIRSIYSSVKSRKFSIHGYADDHQIYKSFPVNLEYQVLCEELPLCFKDIENWMMEHYLMLNSDKTEIIVFGPKQVLSELEINGIFVNSSICVRLVNFAKNLGFTLDSKLTLDTQIKKLKAANCNKLRNIAKMKPFLTSKQMEIIIQALVMSSLDYCNSLYYGINQSLHKQLQSLQNRACRIIKGLKKKDGTEPHLQELHWLRIQERIEFKILLLTFKSINGIAPSYLSNLVTYDSYGSRDIALHSPVSNSSRAFSVVAPRLWNDLPQDIKQSRDINIFKNKLKSHLFRRSYNLY